ncbi:MAG: hypothetical protein UY48_C0002G0021 [Candidatus Gottesmanbacteria bacterium GW2011_GWB1_49_7]|uniref:Uncharacterized protein n=1 Tax=Candidatus Gottesmanbacteria bacterium GW2011_GWB1_49_7 TaxID=1618448 RepID=A0A0G1W423_9BACT|nr:MAG: hypothetical protein UY48_C0002G0021 [Candidatus Gottesmanbacteria bacterium GW2011_GWB1_49_7]
MNYLTMDELQRLPEGTTIMVVWSGGNGPYRYTLTFTPLGACAQAPNICYLLAFVGKAHCHTRVWLDEPRARGLVF